MNNAIVSECMWKAVSMERCGARRLEAMGARLTLLRERNWRLEGELLASRSALQQARGRIGELERQLTESRQQNAQLSGQLQEIKDAVVAQAGPRVVPAFVRANVSQETKKRPGRKAGHAASHRPMPMHVDIQVEVPAPRDGLGQASCPACHAQLQDVHSHRRIVEDIVPARRLVTCYHTQSGYCPQCRRRMETRHAEQPPAPPGVELHQGQLGINSLATAALLRLRYRLPYRQISALFLDLPGISISPGALARQMQRMAGWLKDHYQRLKALIRLCPAVHMDETSWRVDGVNHWLWTMLGGKATLYEVNKSRGQKVAGELLGEHFGGVLISDFYGGYARIDSRKQKCLVHLLRELKETGLKEPAFAAGAFCGRVRRLIREMLLLKKKKPTLPVACFAGRVDKLERRLLELERGRWEEKHAQRLAKRLRAHSGQFTEFLRNDAVDGDNNAAERALRPAVVLRKITGGSRSAAGAEATAVLLSVVRTAIQQGCPLFETVKTLLSAHWAGQNPALLTDLFKN